MAGDLRAIVTAIRLASEIERSADLMVNVAKGARRLYGMEHQPKLRGLIQQMSDEALLLMRLASDAYVDGDDAKAAALDDLDDRLDDIQRDYIAALLECVAAEQIDSRPPCSWRSSAATTSGSATTPSTSASGCATW